jgi:hypothetical protein
VSTMKMDDLSTCTTLESNKSLLRVSQRVRAISTLAISYQEEADLTPAPVPWHVRHTLHFHERAS